MLNKGYFPNNQVDASSEILCLQDMWGSTHTCHVQQLQIIITHDTGSRTAFVDACIGSEDKKM